MPDKNSEIIDALRQARRESFRDVETAVCEECQSLFGPEVKKITEKYCADCFLEINFGIIPKNRGHLRY